MNQQAPYGMGLGLGLGLTHGQRAEVSPIVPNVFQVLDPTGTFHEDFQVLTLDGLSHQDFLVVEE